MSRLSSDEVRRITEKLDQQCRRVVALLDASVDRLSGGGEGDDDLALIEDVIDQEEAVLEEECFRIVALHQPMGTDLRTLATVLHANGDLERAADHAMNILRCRHALPAPADLPQPFLMLAAKVKEAMRRSCQALVARDPAAAREVILGDQVIDSLEDAADRAARTLAVEHPERVESAFLLSRVAHELERVADLAKNLAEDVLYLHTGEIVRHQRL
jgi:phosphate transport system protein